jgi:HEPN domain-containing protein
MAERRLVDEWLAKAEEDVAFARVNLEERKPFFAQICFHVHQAAEKYLKAFIVARNLSCLKTHDLPILVKSCAAADPAAHAILEIVWHLLAQGTTYRELGADYLHRRSTEQTARRCVRFLETLWDRVTLEPAPAAAQAPER